MRRPSIPVARRYSRGGAAEIEGFRQGRCRRINMADRGGVHDSGTTIVGGGGGGAGAGDVPGGDSMAQINAEMSKMQLQTTVTVGKHAMAVRLSLFLLIRVLLQILAREGDRQARAKVQQALKYCQKKNREGDPAFRSLAVSIQKLVRAIVGEKRWKQAEMACVVVMSKKTPKAQSLVKRQELLSRSRGPLKKRTSSGSVGLGGDSGGSAAVEELSMASSQEGEEKDEAEMVKPGSNKRPPPVEQPPVTPVAQPPAALRQPPEAAAPIPQSAAPRPPLPPPAASSLPPRAAPPPQPRLLARPPPATATHDQHQRQRRRTNHERVASLPSFLAAQLAAVHGAAPVSGSPPAAQQHNRHPSMPSFPFPSRASPPPPPTPPAPPPGGRGGAPTGYPAAAAPTGHQRARSLHDHPALRSVLPPSTQGAPLHVWAPSVPLSPAAASAAAPSFGALACSVRRGGSSPRSSPPRGPAAAAASPLPTPARAAAERRMLPTVQGSPPDPAEEGKTGAEAEAEAADAAGGGASPGSPTRRATSPVPAPAARDEVHDR